MSDVVIGEEVSIMTRDGVELKGNLLKPEGVAPFPLIVFVMGSGADTYKNDWRYENYYLCRTIATICTAEGFAFLLMEKRGIEGSGGTWKTQTFEDRAEDIYDVIQQMKLRSDIIADEISVAGQSQGGWIVQLIAAKYPKEIRSALSTAGPVYSVIEQIVDSRTLLWKRKGVPKPILHVGEWLLKGFFHTYKALSRVKKLGYLSYILAYDARDTVPKVKAPLYLVFAENDSLVPLNINDPLARTLLKDVKIPYQVRVVAKTNHAFATAEMFQTWDEIESKPSPHFIEAVVDFCNWTKSLYPQKG